MEDNYSNPVVDDCRISFAVRPPSTGWEPFQLPTEPPRTFWVWFKPQNLPTAIVVQNPTDTDTDTEIVPVSARYLLQMLGLDPVCVPVCSLFGFQFPGQGGTAPYFDQAIVAAPEGADPNIVFYVDPPPMFEAPVFNPEISDDGEVSEYSDDQIDQIFDSMDRDWKGCIQSERQLSMLQKQLLDLQVRLGMMNRDLSPDERVYSTRADQDDWQDARRALRDAATRVSRNVKELNAGETTYAGKKRWFVDIRKKYVIPRLPFDGMESARQEFEIYRSATQHLVTRMQSAYHHGRQEGEVRAQQVLNQIATRVSTTKRKR